MRAIVLLASFGAATAAAVAAGGMLRDSADDALSPASASPWPRPGSFAGYLVVSTLEVPGHAETTWTNLSLRFDGSLWQATCAWHRRSTDDGSVVDARGEDEARSQAVTIPPGTAPGDAFALDVAAGCNGAAPEVVADAAGSATEPRDASEYRTLDARWDVATGIVLAWDVANLHSAEHGRLVRTDASIE